MTGLLSIYILINLFRCTHAKNCTDSREPRMCFSKYMGKKKRGRGIFIEVRVLKMT